MDFLSLVHKKEERIEPCMITLSKLAEGLTFKDGNLEGNGSVTIDCVFIGDIHVDDLVVVGESACVSGNIFAKQIKICGNVEGDVTAMEKIEICEGGVLNGNITCEFLEVDGKAAFSGSCNMPSSRTKSVVGSKSSIGNLTTTKE